MVKEIGKKICQFYRGRKDQSSCGDCFGERDNYLGCRNLAEWLVDSFKEKTCSFIEVREGWWDSDGYWECSICGSAWCFMDGMSPEENEVSYCQKCGAKIIEYRHHIEEDEEEEE